MLLYGQPEKKWVTAVQNWSLCRWIGDPTFKQYRSAHRRFFQAQNNARPCWVRLHPFFHQRFACASAWQQRLPGRQGRTEESGGWKPNGSATSAQEDADPSSTLWDLTSPVACEHDNARALPMKSCNNSHKVSSQMTFFQLCNMLWESWLFSSAVLARKLGTQSYPISTICSFGERKS